MVILLTNYEFYKNNNFYCYLGLIFNTVIKNHLLKLIKNYFFVSEKENGQNKRKYKASIQKFNNIVTYNENI